MPALKQLSAEGLRDQFEQVPATYNMFEEDTEARFVNGKGFRIPSYLRPPTGVSGIGDGGSFAQPGAETYDDMYVYPMSLTMAFEITGRTLRNVEDESSLLDGFKGFLEKRTMALKKEANFQVFNDGSALRGIYKSGTTTVTLYNAIDHTPLANFGSTKGAVQMRVGERYDVYDATLTTLRASAVTPTAKTNKTITIAAAIPGATDGDVFVLSNSLFKTPRGLPYIVNNDTGIFQLQSRATYPQLKAPVTDLNGSAIAVADFTKTKNLLIARAGVGKAKTVMAIMSLAQDDALRRLGQNYKRFDGDARKFDGSFDAFGHGDTVFNIDPDCDEDRIYLTVKSELKRYVEKRFGLYDEDGNEIRMRSGVAGYGSDSWTGAIGAHWNYGTPEPRCHALIKRCAVSGLSTQVLAEA
jgi:phosphoribosyl-AMP cyclohydrolase